MEDEWETPLFAFHELDYIPFGYGGILAPYIESGPGTMRAAVKLMGLDMPLTQNAAPAVVADLGCGDGEFLIGMLTHLNLLSSTSSAVTGVGIDYSPSLIATASSNAILASQSMKWLTYDFNTDDADLATQLQVLGVTHVFVYLVPKQLALKTVRNILERLWESGVMVCCHKFQPDYLKERRVDVTMNLVVYEKKQVQ